jgi:hypothetical protein
MTIVSVSSESLSESSVDFVPTVCVLIAEKEAFDVLIVDTEAFDFVSMCFDRRDRNFIQDEEERG